MSKACADLDTVITVFTVEQIYSLKPGQLEARLTWMRSQGIEPDDTFRVEVYRAGGQDGDHYARVSVYEKNADGHRYCGVDHDHTDTTSAPCQLAQRSYDIQLSLLPREAL